MYIIIIPLSITYVTINFILNGTILFVNDILLINLYKDKLFLISLGVESHYILSCYHKWLNIVTAIKLYSILGNNCFGIKLQCKFMHNNYILWYINLYLIY